MNSKLFCPHPFTPPHSGILNEAGADRGKGEVLIPIWTRADICLFDLEALLLGKRGKVYKCAGLNEEKIN